MGKAMRMMMATAAFLFVAQWSRPAAADVTITGTVGEIGTKYFYPQSYLYQGGQTPGHLIRFKLTDATQTATCTDSVTDTNFKPVASTAKYAWFWDTVTNSSQDGAAKEWYAMLLVSKKGAPIVCTVQDANNCKITSCTLP